MSLRSKLSTKFFGREVKGETHGSRSDDLMPAQRRVPTRMSPPRRDGQADLGEMWWNPEDGEMWVYASEGWKQFSGDGSLMSLAYEPNEDEKRYLRESLGLPPEVEL